MKDFTPDRNYVDMEGNLKTFTHIDYDLKTEISPYSESDQEKADREEWMKNFRKEKIKEILSLPAVSAAYYEHLRDFVIPGEHEYTWNKEVLENADNIMLYNIRLLTWRNTVKEVYWFHEMDSDHEAIITGRWRELI